MADLLREGYTMLNQACPNCKNPIFRSRSGDMFCPTCNKPVVFYEKNVDPPKIKESQIEEELINRETGDNPVRSRRCVRRRTLQNSHCSAV